MNKAYIQVQDITGDWKTIQSTMNQDQMIFRSLQAVQLQYKRLVRAIDDQGIILQMM